MPSTSAKQAKFMRAIAHSPSFAKKVGVKQSVGKDFEMADKKKMKKFGSGGSTPPQPTAAERASDAKFRASVKNIKVTPAEGKVVDSANRSEGSPAPKKYASGGGVTKQMPSSKAMGSMNMAKGGKAKAKPMTKGKAMMAAAMMKDRIGRALAARGAEAPMPAASSAPMAPAASPMGGMGMKKGGKAKAKSFAATKFGAAMTKKSADTKGRAMKKMAKGGGIEAKGKTKTTMVKMGRGGMMKKGGKTC